MPGSVVSFVIRIDKLRWIRMPQGTPENLLARNVKADAANLKWLTDIKYVPTEQGWLYVSVVLDLYSRRIIGWSFHSKLTHRLPRKHLQWRFTNTRPHEGFSCIATEARSLRVTHSRNSLLTTSLSKVCVGKEITGTMRRWRASSEL